MDLDKSSGEESKMETVDLRVRDEAMIESRRLERAGRQAEWQDYGRNPRPVDEHGNPHPDHDSFTNSGHAGLPRRCHHPSSWDVTRAHQQGVLDRAELEARNPKPGKYNCYMCGMSGCITLTNLGDGHFCTVECRNEWHMLNPGADHGEYGYVIAPSPPPDPTGSSNNGEYGYDLAPPPPPYPPGKSNDINDVD